MNIEKALILTYSAKSNEGELSLRFWNPLLYLVLISVSIINIVSVVFYRLKWRYMITGSLFNGKPTHVQKFKNMQDSKRNKRTKKYKN